MSKFSKEDIIICLQCQEELVIMTSAREMLAHQQHGVKRPYVDIVRDLNKDLAFVQDFQPQNDLSLLLIYIDSCTKNLINNVTSFFDDVKKQAKLAFFEAQRKRDVLSQILKGDLPVISKLKGDLSFLLNVKELPQENKKLQEIKNSHTKQVDQIFASANHIFKRDPQIDQLNQEPAQDPMNKSMMRKIGSFLWNGNGSGYSKQEIQTNEVKKQTKEKPETPSHEIKKQVREKYVFDNGDQYEGDFKEQRMNGRGKYYWINGDIFEGNYKDDKRTGKGKLKYINGDTYEGEYRDDRRNGKGFYLWHNGDQYEGQWNEDKRTGRGKFTWPNGEIYEGDFVNNKQQGKGKQTLPDGTVKEGIWIQGILSG